MENPTILITGVAGCIGSHVTVHFVKTYPHYNIVGLDKISYCSNLKNLEEIRDAPNFTFVQQDIMDIEGMQHLFMEYEFHVVFHFAAYTHVDHSFANSILFTKNNVLGTHVLLEVSKECGVQKFIHISTDEVYGDRSGKCSTEETILAPTNPYAATKAAAEHLVRSYSISFGVPIIITRGNNVYGTHQYPEKVIPKFIQHLARGERCPIQGSGQQTRSFLYMEDVVSAFDIIFHRGSIGETYNIGSGKEYSVLDVHSRLAKIIHPEDDPLMWRTYIKDRDFNDQRYYISRNKLEALGWRQKISFDVGLQKTVDWYMKHPNYYD